MTCSARHTVIVAAWRGRSRDVRAGRVSRSSRPLASIRIAVRQCWLSLWVFVELCRAGAVASGEGGDQQGEGGEDDGEAAVVVAQPPVQLLLPVGGPGFRRPGPVAVVDRDQ